MRVPILFGARPNFITDMPSIIKYIIFTHILLFSFFAFLSNVMVILPHSRIRFATIHELHWHTRWSKWSEPYLVSGKSEEPRQPSYYVAFLCPARPVLQRQHNKLDHDKYLSDLRRRSTIDTFFHNISIRYPILILLTYEASKQHRFDWLLHALRNSRCPNKVTSITYSGYEFNIEHESAVAL